jgi:hypothetical protein
VRVPQDAAVAAAAAAAVIGAAVIVGTAAPHAGHAPDLAAAVDAGYRGGAVAAAAVPSSSGKQGQGETSPGNLCSDSCGGCSDSCSRAATGAIRGLNEREYLRRSSAGV